ncbi:hypothetical protein [Pontivivens insulae]|uniref:Polyketide cyclase / dehydrase and lipid transport n=1 Tax=Pontivivens insulae TaxID=1639689 RepID=A0A2R8AEB1_9RHOB|nr:hypothetical protein [Pontivivens insulae]RED14303.1 hypothetical protein DFR53_1660 [Pontivivens insulae]SPF30380.1 hypothetical protein POI8812_02716 [Pontivivens insulae]
MKLTSSTRVAAAADTVRATFANPEELLDGVNAIALTPTGPHEWEMQVEMGGRSESGTLRYVETVGDTVQHEALSAGLQVLIAGHCVAAGDETDLTVDVEMKAKSMKAKMFLPALSMMQGQIEKGLDKALGKLARRMAEDGASAE